MHNVAHLRTVLSPLPFRSTHRSSDSTSLTVTSRCFLMIQPLLDGHLIREWSGKMGRPSLTLSSWSKVNINTSKTKEIEVLSFKAVFCWEGGTRNDLIILVKKTSSVIGQDRQDEGVSQAYAHYGQHRSPPCMRLYIPLNPVIKMYSSWVNKWRILTS